MSVLITRLANLLDYTIQGAWPDGDCAACRAALADRCGECTQREADWDTLNRAITSVQQAATDSQAASVFAAAMADLTGMTQFADPAATAGGAR